MMKYYKYQIPNIIGGVYLLLVTNWKLSLLKNHVNELNQTTLDLNRSFSITGTVFSSVENLQIVIWVLILLNVILFLVLIKRNPTNRRILLLNLIIPEFILIYLLVNIRELVQILRIDLSEIEKSNSILTNLPFYIGSLDSILWWLSGLIIFSLGIAILYIIRMKKNDE